MESCTSAREAPRALMELEKRRSGAFKQKKVYQNRTIIKEVTSKKVNQFAQSLCTTTLHIARELHERSWSSTSAREAPQALVELERGD